MRLELQRTENDAVIVAGGRLTFSQAGRLHSALLEAIAGDGRVDLFLHDVEEADLSFLQLLCAAHRTAAAQGAVFTLGGLDSAGPIRRLIHEAGAERGEGCPTGCIWADAIDSECGDEAPAHGQRRKP